MVLKESRLLQEHPLLTMRRGVVKLELEADRHENNNIQHFLSNNKYLLSDILWYKRTDIVLVCASGQSHFIFLQLIGDIIYILPFY